MVVAFSLLGSVAQGQTFNATGTGAIPDSPNGTCWATAGTPLSMPIAVSGVGGAITNLSVSLTMTHTWVADLNVTLTAPGGSPSFTIFGRTGSAGGSNCGYSSNLSGTYVFADPSATSNNWWTAANVSDASNIATGTYFTTPLGVPAGVVPTAGTAFNAAFAALTPAQINGTWTLTITDNTSGDTGSVSAASLTLTAGAPPAVAYAPAPNAAPATVTFATGAATITATPSGGSGSGAASTTTVNGCAISGVSGPGSFGSVAGVNLSFVGSTIAAQNIGLTCTGGTSPTTASLSCNETRGSSAAVVRTWGLTCPAGNIAPTFAYSPAANATITATGGTTVGTTGNMTLSASIATAGSGSGAAATTTTTCSPVSAPFSGFTGSVSAVGGGAISGSPLTGTCTLGASAATQTLSCSENRGGTPTPVSFQLSCPAGTLLPAQISSTPAAGLITFGTVGVSASSSRTISITNAAGVNSNDLIVSGCSFSPAGQGFSLAGVPSLSLAPGASGSIVVNYSPLISGVANASTLTCNVGNVTGISTISWTLAGNAQITNVPTLSAGALAALLVLLGGLGLALTRRYR